MLLASLGLAVPGLVALGYRAWTEERARRFQAQEIGHLFDSRLITRPAAVHPARGAAVAQLSIPRLGLSAIVVEGSGEQELALGPGHIEGTALPGTAGNVGLAGHRDTFFRPLRQIQEHDAITLATDERRYNYTVVSTEIVGPKDVRVLWPSGRDTLTLITCYPFYFIGAAPKRFIVHADCTNCSNSKGDVTYADSR